MPSLWTSTRCEFSDDGRHRYTLIRCWDEMLSTGPDGSRAVAFIMLNPSTADETKDDPSVRRCLGYAYDWGYDSLIVVNLFSLRSTDPKALYTTLDADGGRANDSAIIAAARNADMIVCAWGEHGKYQGRGRAVAGSLSASGFRLHALRVNAGGEPAHPLYLPGSLALKEYHVV